MIRRFTSVAAEPAQRGREFGAVHAREVAQTVAAYRRLFRDEGSQADDVDLDALGGMALERIDGWAPELGAEIRGIAEGAGQPVTHIAAINARTEILALLRPETLRPETRGECSTVVALGGAGDEPVAMQNWDWYTGLADNWLEWTIPHPDGRRVTTVTEYGIVGKIGVNDRGVGILFNMLHHRDDGGFLGVPVHVVARRILDTAADVSAALLVCGSARVSASTAITLVGGRSAGKAAVSTELWPGGPGHALPTEDGLLLRTNHFLSHPGRLGDTGPAGGSDTLIRYDALSRGLRGRGAELSADQVRSALSEHNGLLCCHPDPRDPADAQFATLATVRLDLASSTLVTQSGPPCGAGATP